MPSLADWDKIETSQEFSQYKPEEQDAIKFQWFKKNIVPTQEWESYDEDKQVQILNAFARRKAEIKKQDRSFMEVAADFPKAMVRGLDRAGESVGSTMEMFNIPGGTYVKDLYWERAERQEIAKPRYLQEGTVVDHPERLVDPSWWVNSLGENLPNMIMMMAPGVAAYRGAKALGAVAKAAKTFGTLGAGAGAFTIESGSAYNEAKEDMLRNGYDEKTADSIATAEGITVGLVNSLLEAAPFGVLLRNPGGKKILARVVRQGILEGTTESIQENVQMLAAKLGHGKDTELKDWIGKTIESGLIGTVLGGGMGVFGGVDSDGQNVQEEPDVSAQQDTKQLYTKEDAAAAQAQKEAEYDELRRQRAIQHGDALAEELEQKRIKKLKHLKFAEPKSKSKIPSDLEPAIEIMKQEVANGDVQKNEFGHRIGSTYPNWFRKAQLTRKDFNTVIGKLEEGKPLTDYQFGVWRKINDSANEYATAHPDLIMESEAIGISNKGFEPVMGRIEAGELQEGDEIIVRKGLGGDDVLRHKGYDKDGFITLQDGETIKVEPWDTVDVEGVKRNHLAPKATAEGVIAPPPGAIAEPVPAAPPLRTETTPRSSGTGEANLPVRAPEALPEAAAKEPPEVLKDYPDLAPKEQPAQTKPESYSTVTPEAQAQKHDLTYNGPQVNEGFPTLHIFTDNKTGDTFSAQSLDEVPQKVSQVRQAANQKARENFQNITTKDVREMFKWAKGARVRRTDGAIIVEVGSRILRIKNVQNIGIDEAAFSVERGRKPSEGEIAAGSYQDGEIKISRIGDKWTLAHESFHWMEDIGVINSADVRAIERDMAKGDYKFDKDDSPTEKRAKWFEQAKQKRDTKGRLGRAIQKIQDFIDSIVNMFHRTARGVVRDIESGKIFEGRSEKSGVDATSPLYEVRAYHGSPHSFDSFSMSGIGTGEGAQAFGWGLYFTELDDIAHHYANVPKAIDVVHIDGKPYHRQETIAATVLRQTMRQVGNKKHLVLHQLNNVIEGIRRGDPQFQNRSKLAHLEAKELVENANKIELKNTRNKYHVTLHKGKKPGDYVWLDWDKPVPEKIADILIKKYESGEFKIDESKGTRNFIEGLRGLDVFKKLEGIGYKIKDGKVFRKNGTQVSQDVIDAQKQLWESSVVYRDGGHFYRDLSHMMGSDMSASLALLDAGIDGIRYPAGSLSGMEGDANNYVVFDENAVTIEKHVQYSTKRAEEQGSTPNLLQRGRDEVMSLYETVTTTRFKPGGWAARTFASPEWGKDPRQQKIVDDAHNGRDESKYEFFNFQNHDKETGLDVGKTIKDLKYKGKNSLHKIRTTDLYNMNNPNVSQEYRQLAEAIVYMDENHVKWQDYKPELVKRGASQEVIQTIDMMRRAWDKSLDLQRLKLKQILDAWEKAHNDPNGPVLFSEKTPGGKRKNYTLRDAYESMGQHRGYYAPRIREAGDWAIKSQKNGTTYRYQKPTKLSASKFAKQLKREGHTGVEFAPVTKLPESVYHDITVGDVAQLLNKAIDRSNLSDKEVAKAHIEIIEEAANLLKARAFRSHKIKRKGGAGDAVKGYIEDPLTRYLVYVNRLAGGLAKAKFAQESMQTLQQIDATKNPELYDYMKSYIQEQLRNQDKIDRGIGVAKSIISMKYLGFNPKAAVVNTTALITTAPSAIRTYALDGKVGFANIGKELTKAMKDYAKVMTGKNLENADEQSFMDSIKESGYDNPQYMRDALGDIQAFHGKAWSNIMQLSMTPFAKTEQWNRGTTMLAAYRLARSMGKTHEDAMRGARTASDKAHGLYGRATLPSWAQGRGAFKRVMQMGYTYQKFGHNYVQMLADIGYNKKDYYSLGMAIALPAVIGGAASSIAWNSTMAVANALFHASGDDRDLEKIVFDYIRKELGDDAEIASRYGVFGFLGIDLSGSLSVGMQVPSHLIDLTGAFGGAYKEAVAAKDYFNTNQYSRALEKALPTVAGNVIRAYREHKTGVYRGSGEPLFTDEGQIYKPTWLETIRKGASFRSAREAALSERRYEVRKEKDRYYNKRQNIYNEFEAWFANRGDKEWFDAIMSKVLEYNDKIIKENRQNIAPLITPESLIRKAERMTKPNNREFMELQ